MDENESLSHSRWECKYHVVFIPAQVLGSGLPITYFRSYTATDFFRFIGSRSWAPHHQTILFRPPNRPRVSLSRLQFPRIRQ